VTVAPGSPVQAVIFDWGGTLTPWHTIDIREVWRAYARAYTDGGDHAVEELAARLHAAEDEAWAAVRDHHRSATMDEVFRAAGVEPAGGRHADALAAYQLAFEPHTWTDAQAGPTLEALRARGLRVGLLSNTFWSRAHHEQVLARDGVLDLFDGLTFSSELPWTKPHPDAFLAAMAAVAVTDPASVVFVGDRPFDDIHGARAVGMRTVLVPHSDIPPAQRGHTEGEPDAVIQRLGELVAVVDGWLGSGAGVPSQPGEGLRHA
jgi:putative hydrolase of the HAD superfamily